MDRGKLLRRAVHMSTPLFLVYYFLPDPLLWGIDNRVALLILYAGVMTFELLRLIFEPTIIGMREYERYRVSAAAWASTAFTVAFVFFPFEFAAPAMIGMGLVDPLIGELRFRSSHLYPMLPAGVYLLITFVSLASLMEADLSMIAMASLTATFLALAVERMRTRLVDDDFLMVIVPMIGLELMLA
jgi:hypothetical protein